MWRGANDDGEDGDASDEIASSFASSRSVPRDSQAEETRRVRPGHTTRVEADGEGDAYDDDDFERYSDEFESDNDDANGGDNEGGGDASDSVHVWRAGDRVQVYWEDECAWFDGVLARVEPTRCFVHYTDGEQQWETHGTIRKPPPPHVPATATAYEQLQQLHADDPQATTTLLGRRVVVHWRDETDWFNGRVDNVDQVTGIHVVYDDGDDQWLSHAAFRDVLVLPIISTATRATESTANRTLTPRAYTPAVEHHFEPVRVARPYKCTVTTGHIGSILTPRSWNTPRPFYLPRVVAQLDCDSRAHRLPPSSSTYTTARDCHVQTEISVATAEASSSSSSVSFSSLSLSPSSSCSPCPISV